MLIFQIIVGVAIGVFLGGCLLHVLLARPLYLHRCLELLAIGLALIFIGIPFLVYLIVIAASTTWNLCTMAVISYSACSVFFAWGTILTGFSSVKDVPYSICFAVLTLISACISLALFSSHCPDLMAPYTNLALALADLLSR